jgi:hypothetical protein
LGQLDEVEEVFGVLGGWDVLLKTRKLPEYDDLKNFILKGIHPKLQGYGRTNSYLIFT